MGTTEACLKQAGTCPMHRDSLEIIPFKFSRCFVSFAVGSMNDPTPTPVAQDSAILAVVVVVVVASVALAVAAVAVYRKRHQRLQIGRTSHTVSAASLPSFVGHFIVVYVEWQILVIEIECTMEKNCNSTCG